MVWGLRKLVHAASAPGSRWGQAFASQLMRASERIRSHKEHFSSQRKRRRIPCYHVAWKGATLHYVIFASSHVIRYDAVSYGSAWHYHAAFCCLMYLLTAYLAWYNIMIHHIHTFISTHIIKIIVPFISAHHRIYYCCSFCINSYQFLFLWYEFILLFQFLLFWFLFYIYKFILFLMS